VVSFVTSVDRSIRDGDQFRCLITGLLVDKIEPIGPIFALLRKVMFFVITSHLRKRERQNARIYDRIN